MATKKEEDKKGNVYNIHDNEVVVTENGVNHQQQIEQQIVFNINGEKIDPDFLNQLSDWLKQTRKEKKMTQKELSKKSHIDVKYLQKLESKKYAIQPKLSTFHKLINGLGVDKLDLRIL